MINDRGSMENSWIQAIGKMTFGIYVLTTAHETKINGMIASWVSIVSYDPPLVMVAVHPNRYSHTLIEKSGAFALNILDVQQKNYLARFKTTETDAKFTGIRWEPGKTGCPILNNCVGYIDCVVEERLKPGNHTLFFGKIIDARALNDQLPLTTLEYEGAYLGKN